MTRIGRIGREVAWVGVGQAIALAGTVVGVRLLTEVLRPSTYGQYALALTLVTLVQMGVIGPVGSVAQRFFAPAVESGSLDAYLRALRRYFWRASAVVLLLALATVGVFLLERQWSWALAFAAAGAFGVLTGANGVLNGIQNAARQRKVVALHRAMDQWLRYLLAFALATLLGAHAALVLVGFVIAGLVVVASQLTFFVRGLRPLLRRHAERSAQAVSASLRQMFVYGWPLGILGLCSWAQAATDRFALQIFGTTADVGLYVPIYQLGYTPIVIASNAALQLVQPVIFSRAGDGSDAGRLHAVYRLVGKLSAAALLATGAAVAVTALTHEAIFATLVARDYADVSYLLPFAVLGGGLFATGQVVSLSMLSRMDTRRLIRPRLAAALAGVAVNLAGAMWWGIEGVVGSQVVYGVIFLGWTIIEARTAHAQPLAAAAAEGAARAGALNEVVE